MSRNVLLTLLLLLPTLQLSAQHLIGLAGSNRAGSHAAWLNPSAIADSRQGFHLNLVAAHASFQNTYFHYDGPQIITPDILEDGVEDLFDRAYIQERVDGKPKMFHFGLDMRLPSFMLKLSPKHSIALNTRFRTGIQANDISEELARIIGFGTANPAFNALMLANQEAYFNTNSFAEIGFTYAGVLLSQEKRFLKGGITVKRLRGLYAANLSVSDLSYRIQEDQDGSKYLRVEQGTAGLGFTQSEFDLDQDQVIRTFSGANPPGSGWGIDVGFTYEHRPKFADYQYTLNGEERTDQGSNKYKYRIGASLLDVGGLTYQNPQQVRRYDITRQNLDLTSDLFEDVDTENLGQALEEAFEVKSSERQTSLRSGLPTALHLNLDYRLSRRLFLNAALLQNLRGKEAVALRQFSVFTVAPRLETKLLEMAFPVSLMNDYRDLTLGALVRLGPLTIGSNNLAGALGFGKAVGADVYVGLGFGIGTSGQRKKDERQERNRVKRIEKAAEKGK